MNPLASFAPLAQAFGLTVAHSLWQITLIWLVFKMLEWKLNLRHQVVYLLSLAAMLASILWAISTFMVEWERPKPVETAFSPIQSLDIQAQLAFISIETAPSSSLWQTAQIWLETYSAQIGWGWLVCAGLLWLRLLGGWWLAQRLRKRGVLTVSTAFQTLCNDWAKHLKINTKIQLLESPHISEPLTLGFWKPVVLFPVGMLLKLSPAQVEALLLHELAHIRRHDYLVNLFQLVLEVCFFYHPLFWLLSREARSRREFCCDKLVLKYSTDPILYAKTLTDLQLSTLQPSTTFVMNATGKSRFTERILYIVGLSPKRSARPNWLIVMMLPTLVVLCSWWPSISQSTTTQGVNLETSTISDSIPPRKSPDPTAIAMPKNNAQPAPKKDLANVADDLGKKVEAERISINLEPSTPENVAMEVVKMNVLYIGVDNPLRVAAAGIPANELRVQLIGKGSIEGGNSNYVVRVVEPGEVKLRVSRQVGNDLKFVVDQKYRVKRIPDPMPKLDGQYSSRVVVADLMYQTKGISPILENLDFEVSCEIVGFEATYLPLKEDPITKVNKGGEWNSDVLEWIKKAKPGDAYFFDDIQVKCPGDTEPRNVGGLAFKIK